MISVAAMATAALKRVGASVVVDAAVALKCVGASVVVDAAVALKRAVAASRPSITTATMVVVKTTVGATIARETSSVMAAVANGATMVVGSHAG